LGVCSIEENTVPRDWEKKFLLQIVVPIEKIVRKMCHMSGKDIKSFCQVFGKKEWTKLVVKNPC
jgi:hypothetical protein